MTNRKRKYKPKSTSFGKGRASYHHPGIWTKIHSYSFLKKKNRAGCLVGGIGVVALYIFVFYYFFVSPTGFRWRALYGEVDPPKGYSIHGIDVSHHQGKIEWDKLKSNALIDGKPLRFVFMKGTEGSSRVDPNFDDNFIAAREYGFLRGVYHFWSNKSPARSQAYFFLSKVHLDDEDLPPVLDIEHVPQNVNIEDFQRDVLTWLHIVEDKYHVKPIIYTYSKFRTKYLNAPVFDDYPYWIAHYYIDKIEYKGNWRFWQHTDTGKLPGINGNVDLNVYNGTYYELMQLTIGKQK